MAEVVYTTIFKFKRGTADAWNKVNPVLAEAEPGFELDTGKLKIGNGLDDWKTLKYFSGDFNISADGKSISINSDHLELYGFSTANVGYVPRKGEDGTLEWYDPSSTKISVSRLINDENTTLILNGGNAEISV